jgi:hypothetical protein
MPCGSATPVANCQDILPTDSFRCIPLRPLSYCAEFPAHKISIAIQLLARRNSLIGTKIPLFRQVTNLRRNPLNRGSILGVFGQFEARKRDFRCFWRWAEAAYFAQA